MFKKLISLIFGRKDGADKPEGKAQERPRDGGWRPGDPQPQSRPQQPRGERGPRPERGERPDRGDRPDRGPRPPRDGQPREGGEFGPDGDKKRRRRRRRGGNREDGPREEGQEGAPTAERGERPPREDRGPRPERSGGGDRGERRDRGGDRGERGGRGGRDGGRRRKNIEDGGGVVLETRSTIGVERPERIAMNEIMEPGEFGEFQELDLPRPILQAIADLNITTPTPVQAQAIPIIQRGRDLIARAPTGTGKTAAFSLPTLAHLREHGALRVLVLEPTRELAIQVGQSCEDYAKYTDLRVAIICGGVNYNQQLKSLQEGPDLIAATPGRLLDHHENKHLSLDSIEVVILDEVDRMLDMGFLPDVRRIVQFCRNRKQTLLFSATMPPQIESLAEWALKEPEKMEIGVRTRPSETINHAFYPIAGTQKLEFLLALVENQHLETVIVFTRTRMGADMVAERIASTGKEVAALHSDRSQSQRLEALNGFQEGKYKVLVATDIAARGLHIPNVGHVINFDIPENPEDYVHRIGRTGRALSTGEAHTLVTGEDIKYMNAIEEYIGYPVQRKKLEGFEYVYNRMLEGNDAGHTPGKFRSTRKKRR
jgi:ATP-dependent RNA helicase RhlE